MKCDKLHDQGRLKPICSDLKIGWAVESPAIMLLAAIHSDDDVEQLERAL